MENRVEQHKRLIIKALQRYRTRIEEVGDMGWYDDPSVTVTEVARVDDTIAWVEGLDAQPQQPQALDMSQPDWSQAPEWATYWTRDRRGVMWWETKPVFDGRLDLWMCEDDNRRVLILYAPVLRKRPTA